VTAVAPLLSGAIRVWRHEVVVYRHMAKWLLIPGFLDPLLVLAAMGLGLGGYLASVEGARYLDFIAPGIVGSSIMYSASFEVTWNVYWKLETSKVYAAMLAAPLLPADITLGEMLWGATRAVISGLIVFVVVAAFGLLHSPMALLMPAVVVLVAVNFAALGLTFSSFVTHLGFFAYYFTIVITPMLLLSGIFFPVTELPVWVQTLASVFPLTHGVDLLRGLSFGDSTSRDLWHVAYLVAVPLVLMPIAVRQLGRRMRA
jgi:lipooligosaccharide transport system permease protein